MTPQAVLVWLGTASLVSTLLTVGVLFLRRPVARVFGARAAFALWAAPALRLILPPLGLGLLVWPMIGQDSPAAVAAPILHSAPPPLVFAVPIAPSGGAGFAEPGVAEVGSALPSLWLLLLAAWLVGTGIALGAGWLSTASWRRALLRERARPTAPALKARLGAAAREAGYRGPVDLVVTAAASSPQVLGLRRPLVAVPERFEIDFSPSQQRLAFLHECTHLARKDLWALAFAEALCAVHWFNPLLRWSLPAFRADQEAACDETVRSLGAPAHDYADALLRAARGPLVPALTLNHDLKRRIETMTRPLPRNTARVFGTACALALAVGAAAATQEGSDDGLAPTPASAQIDGTQLAMALSVAMAQERSDDPNALPTGEKDRREVRVFSFSGDDGENNSFRFSRSGETDMVLLSDPFAALMPERPEPPAAAERQFGLSVPKPPKPPKMDADGPRTVTIVGEDGETKRTIELAPGERLEMGDGRSVIVVPAFPEDFEVRMEAFAEKMEDWGETFGDGFEAKMSRFGERMGSWGEKMGAVGEAVGELSERCEDHRNRTTKPTVLKARVEGSDEVVKAVCARGGAERYASVEMERFVERQRGLSADEKAAFKKNRARGGFSFSSN